jgi:hypothetical protein
MKRETRRIIFLSLLLGMEIGLGAWFRQVCSSYFCPVSFLWGLYVFICSAKKRYGQVSSVCLLICLHFLVLGSPILSAVAQDKWCCILSFFGNRGLATSVEQKSLGGTASYRLVYEPDDMLVHSTIASYARRIGFQKPFDKFPSSLVW